MKFFQVNEIDTFDGDKYISTCQTLEEAKAAALEWHKFMSREGEELEWKSKLVEWTAKVPDDYIHYHIVQIDIPVAVWMATSTHVLNGQMIWGVFGTKEDAMQRCSEMFDAQERHYHVEDFVGLEWSPLNEGNTGQFKSQDVGQMGMVVYFVTKYHVLPR